MNYLKKCLVFILMLPVLLFADAQANNGYLSISTTIQPRATYQLHDLYKTFQSGNGVADLGNIQLTNQTSETMDLMLRFKVYTSYAGSSASPLLDARTNPSSRPISIRPRGTFTFDATNALSMLDRDVKVSESQIKALLQSKYGQQMLMTGLPPEGKIIHEIIVYDAQDSLLNVPLITLVDEIDIRLEDGSVEITYPQDGETVVTPILNFVWQSLNVADNVIPVYKLCFSNDPRFEENTALHCKTIRGKNSTNLQLADLANYRLNGPTYYWQIFASDSTGAPIGTVSRSPIQSFTYYGQNAATGTGTTNSALGSSQSASLGLGSTDPSLQTQNTTPTLSPDVVASELKQALSRVIPNYQSGWQIKAIMIDGKRVTLTEYYDLMGKHNNIDEIRNLK